MLTLLLLLLLSIAYYLLCPTVFRIIFIVIRDCRREVIANVKLENRASIMYYYYYYILMFNVIITR